MDLVVADHHGGLVNAVKRHFQGVAWQRCQVHFMRNILDACPKRHHDALKAKLRPMFNAPDMKTARDLLDAGCAAQTNLNASTGRFGGGSE